MASNESSAELNFKSLILTIKKRKITFISIILTLTILSVIVSYLIPKSYKAAATFEIGYFHNGTVQTYVADPSVMKEKMKSVLIPEDGTGAISSVEDFLQTPGLIRVVSMKNSVDEAVSGIEDAFKTFYQMHVDLMEAASDYSMFEKQIRAIVYDQYKRDKKMSKEDINDVVLNAIIEVTNQIGMKHAASNFIEGKSTAEELGGFSPPKIVGKIEALPYPVSPNKRVIVSLTFIVSIFLSLMYVFFSEFLKEVLREEKN